MIKLTTEVVEEQPDYTGSVNYYIVNGDKHGVPDTVINSYYDAIHGDKTGVPDTVINWNFRWVTKTLICHITIFNQIWFQGIYLRFDKNTNWVTTDYLQFLLANYILLA